MIRILIALSPVVLIVWLWWGSHAKKPLSPEQSATVETFDSASLSALGRALEEHQLTRIVTNSGQGNSRALRVDYQGYERGSRRVVVSPRIEPAEQYDFSFWVQFCEGFDFARGGKLHGVGPSGPVTGGNPVTPDGWSARLMFRGDGGLQTYIYHQGMAGRFGDTQRAAEFAFEPGRYYHVRMRVTLNTPAQESNGHVTVWVDDERLIEHTGLRFRDREGDASQIQRLLFSTFHGGSSPDWAPRHSDGRYKTDCAFFDNIELIPSPGR